MPAPIAHPPPPPHSHSTPPHPHPSPLHSYTPAQLHAHLARLHIHAADSRLLLDEDVDGQSALALSHDNLTQLGVATFGRRQRLLDAVAGAVVGKAGEGQGEGERVEKGKGEEREKKREERHDELDEQEMEHQRREKGGLFSHIHLPRPHTASHPYSPSAGTRATSSPPRAAAETSQRSASTAAPTYSIACCRSQPRPTSHDRRGQTDLST